MNLLTDINYIHDLLARHGFRFSKSLGQNFLTASWVPEDIAESAGLNENTGVLEIGAGDMTRAEYDPNGRRQDVYAYADGVGVHVYTHQKVGTVHRLTGSGACGRVKLTANAAAGDTVQVNGKTVPAYVGGEAFADALAGEALSGRWLSFVWDGAQVNFKGGGGLTGAKLALADAVPADVRRGRTFYARGRGLQTGTAEYPQYLGVVSATIGANAVLADYTLTPGVWRIVAAAWRDNREYGYIAVQVGGTEHGGTEPTYGHGRVLDVTLTLTENTSCRVLTRSNYVVGGCWAIVRQP